MLRARQSGAIPVRMKGSRSVRVACKNITIYLHGSSGNSGGGGGDGGGGSNCCCLLFIISNCFLGLPPGAPVAFLAR